MTAIGPSFEGMVYRDPLDKSARCLQFTRHNSIKITVHTKADKVKENISLPANLLPTKLNKDFVEIRVGNKPIVVRMTELAKQLNLSPQILKKAKKEGHLKETIDLALDALAARVPFETFSQKKKLANDLKASLANLDALVGQKVVSPTNSAVILTQSTVNKMKEAVQTAYNRFVECTGTDKTEQLSRISEDLQLRIKISEKSLSVATMFGKEIAKGGGGKIARTSHTLVLGKPDSGKHAVVKIPLSFTEDAKQEIMQEVSISKKMNRDGAILGFQAPLSARKVDISGQEALLHTGRLYDGDLVGALPHLSARDKLGVGYQMFHAAAAMHEEEITHGDIKLENFLYEKSRTPTGPRVYLADLAGAKDHTTPQTTAQETFSTWRPLADVKKGRALIKELNNERAKAASNAVDPKERSKLQKHIAELEQKFTQLEKMADVFTLCAAFSLMAVDNPEFSESELRNDTVGHMQSLHIKDKLIKKGWSEPFATLIEKGFSNNTEERPTMAQLLKAYSKELKRQDPELHKSLLALSAPKVVKKLKLAL